MDNEGAPINLWEARASLILHLRQLGITDPDWLRVFESVPHENFIPAEYAHYAYREASIPIGFGQSITSPAILASMMVHLDAFGSHKILEIGTGSGYSAALLSRIAKRVFTIERQRTLASMAHENWKRISYENIVGLHEDGLYGLSQQQPFDRIFLAGSVQEVPDEIVNQLADGGIAVMAIGNPSDKQTILKIERLDDVFLDSEHGTVRLSPLVQGKARAQ